MKKQINIIALIVVILSLGQLIFAQEKIIESSEFNEIKNKSSKLKRENTNRSKELSEVFIDNGVTLKTKSTTIREFIPPDRSYYSYQTEIDGKVYTSEYITIGEKQFVRMNGEKWKVYEPEYGSGALGRSNRTIKFLGTEKLGEKTLSIYELFEKSYSSFSGDMEETTKYWFDEKGFLLKETYKGKSLDKDELKISVTTYDYDAIIKIEAPEIEETPQTLLDARIETRNSDAGNDVPVIVKVSAENKLFLNEKATIKENLVGEFNRLMSAKLPFQEIIYVSSDGDAQYGKIVEIIKIGREANIDDYGLFLSSEKVTDSVNIKIHLVNDSEIIKPDPLLLLVMLDNKNQISINNEKQTEQQLVKSLRKFFKNREKLKVYREGSEEIEKTVFVKAPPSAKYKDVIKIIRLVEKAGAYPVALQINSLSEKPETAQN